MSYLFYLLFAVFAKADGEMSIDVILTPAGSYKAVSKSVQGSAQLKTDGSVEATNVLVDLNDIKTGISLRDKHTKERLNVAQFPKAKLVKAIGKNGKGRARIEIKGKTLDVSGDYQIEGSFLKAKFPVKLSNLDITNVRYMGVGVKDEVTVSINLPIMRAAGK